MLPVSGQYPIGAWSRETPVRALCVDVFDGWNRATGDVNGPTALLKSVSHSAHGSHGDAAEYELEPAILKGEEDYRN